MSSLREWKTTGRIRYTASHIHRRAVFTKSKEPCAARNPIFVDMNYSLMEPEAAQRILPLAQRPRMAVINRPFGGGGLFGRVAAKPLPPWAAESYCRLWAQFFLKWIVAHPAVHWRDTCNKQTAAHGR